MSKHSVQPSHPRYICFTLQCTKGQRQINSMEAWGEQAPTSSHRGLGGEHHRRPENHLHGASPRPPSLLTGERRRRPAAAPKAAVRNPMLPPLASPFLLPSFLSPWRSAAGVAGMGQIRALHGRIRVLPTWICAQGAGAVGQPPLWLS